MSYQLLPALGEQDYARLRDDIALRGVLVPIEVDENGDLLDGHHRRRIANELGVDCPVVVRAGLAEHEKRLHAVALNLARRQLTDAQQIILGQRIKPDVEERARLRMEHRGEDGTNTYGQMPGGLETRDEIADLVGLGSGSMYERNAKVLDRIAESDPNLYEQAVDGSASLAEVQRRSRELKKAERVAEIAATPAAEFPTEQTFPVLYVDPPWRYEGAETPDVRKVENHYPTASLDDIKALHVPASPDAVLFCWATSPKLVEALDLMAAWGFTYRTCMVWVKDRIGMGYYARQRHELLLIGKRGNLPVPDPANRPDSVIDAPRGEHSAKPDMVYDLIEAMYPDFGRCEMFQRRPRDGWFGWGNQA